MDPWAHSAIFVRSYRMDFPWLQYCLASIERYCTGFREVVLVIPRSSRSWARRHGLFDTCARVETCPDVRNDYLGQQASKLLADTFTDAEYVVHVDSDCVFQRQTTPADLMPDGRPRVLYCSTRLLGRHRPWQKPTERFLGWRVGLDYMRHPPFLYPRWLYPELREHCLALHGTDVESYIASQPVRGFSEFNALGAFAHRLHPERFVWIDVGSAGVGDPPCRWYWSWGGLTPGIRREIETLL